MSCRGEGLAPPWCPGFPAHMPIGPAGLLGAVPRDPRNAARQSYEGLSQEYFLICRFYFEGRSQFCRRLSWGCFLVCVRFRGDTRLSCPTAQLRAVEFLRQPGVSVSAAGCPVRPVACRSFSFSVTLHKGNEDLAPLTTVFPPCM